MAKVDLTSLVQEKIKGLKAYHVDNYECRIKLHANENPYPLPPEYQKNLDGCLRSIALNRYPDPEARGLKDALATRLEVAPAQLMTGNGSDELLQLILQVFCREGDGVAFPDPSFAMYSILARGLGLVPVAIPLDERWDFKADALLARMRKENARVVFLSYPNNPTGNCFDAAEVKKVVENFPGIVVLDEAYYDFSGKTFLPYLREHNNLIVLRSLSKIGLAALRVGYGVADPAIIAEINKVRLPYNSNTVSQALAEAVLRNFAPVQRQVDSIIAERRRLLAGLGRDPAVTVFPSDANFILFRLDGRVQNFFRQLAENDVLIRDLGAHPRLAGCLRVTVGTPEENDQFLARLGELTRPCRV